MRKYHPDRHTASPEKQKAANELAQKLTASYEILEKHLRVSWRPDYWAAAAEAGSPRR